VLGIVTILLRDNGMVLGKGKEFFSSPFYSIATGCKAAGACG
jgi:hypothetical protein